MGWGPGWGVGAEGGVEGVAARRGRVGVAAVIRRCGDRAGGEGGEVSGRGADWMVVATVSDGAYAILCGGAGAFLTRQRIKLLSRVSGGFLIGGGVWLALTRAR